MGGKAQSKESGLRVISREETLTNFQKAEGDRMVIKDVG